VSVFAPGTGPQRASETVDFTFSPDQDALRDAVRAFLANEAPGSYVRDRVPA